MLRYYGSGDLKKSLLTRQLMDYLCWQNQYYQISSAMEQCLYLEAGELIGLRFCGGTVRAFVYSINVLIVVNSHGQAVNTQAQLVLPEVNYLC